jgi:hypothetical protein
MLKKVILVAALAAASFVSVNVAGRVAPTAAPAPTTVTMKYPPCDPAHGWGCALNN